jgi:hypothetical protein
VQPFPALHALKLVTITVVLVGEPTLTVTASLTRVRRIHVVNVDTVFLGFVFDVTLELLERLLLELTGVRDSLTNVLQVLGRGSRAIVFHGFPDDCFGDTVQVVGAPSGEAVANRLYRVVC